MEYFPNTETDDTGFEGFLGFAKDLGGNGHKFARAREVRDPYYKPAEIELEVIKETQQLYLDGELTRDEATDILTGTLSFTPSDLQFSRYLPNKVNGNNGNALVSSELEIKVEEEIVPKIPVKKTKVKKGKKVYYRSPLFMHGNIYQYLVGSAISLAYIDQKVYQEFALSYKKEDGVFHPSNIADFVVLEDDKTSVIEVKLGRQRQGLRKQLQKQIAAAKKAGLQGVESMLLLGETYPVFNAMMDDDKEEDHDEDSEMHRRIEEDIYNLQHVTEILEGIPELDIVPASKLFLQAMDNLKSRGKYATDSSINRFVQSGIVKKLTEAKGEEAGKKFIETMSTAQNLITSYFATTLSMYNMIIQSRDLSLADLEHYDKNLYLLNHYIEHKLKKNIRLDFKNSGKRKNRRMKKCGEAAYKEFHDLLEGLHKRLTYKPNEKMNLCTPGMIKASHAITKTWATLYNNSLGLVTKKTAKANDPETIRKRYFQTTEEFWTKFLPNYRQVLREKNIKHYLEDEVVKRARPVFRKKQKDTGLVQEPLSELEAKIKQLETCLDVKAFSAPSGYNARLGNYMHTLRTMNLESCIDDFGQMIEVDRIAKRNKRYRRVIDLWNKITGKKTDSTLKDLHYLLEVKHNRADVMNPDKAMNYVVANAKREKIDAVGDIYKSFLGADVQSLDALSTDIIDYLSDKDIINECDIVYYKNFLKEDAQLDSIVHYNMFSKVNLPQRYMASKMLHVVKTAQAISAIDEEQATNYFNKVRIELATGSEHGSKKLTENLLTELKGSIQ